jgi:DNA-binding response OmpR family regulator
VVTKVSNGDRAVDRIRRGTFDSVILVSTGRKMDLVETILTLRDINPGTPIVVVIDPVRRKPNETAQEIISQAVPRVSMFTIAELQNRLDWVETEKRQTKKAEE